MSFRSRRVVFRFEAATAGLSTFVLLLTVVSREWIELLFPLDPDHGDGSLEWLIVLATGSVAVISFVFGRREYRRVLPA